MADNAPDIVTADAQDVVSVDTQGTVTADAQGMAATDAPDTAPADATYDHVIKYTGLFGGVQGVTMLVSLVRNKIVSVLLGPDGVALINIYNNVIKLVNQSTNFGLSFSAVKHVAELFEAGAAADARGFVRTVRTWSVFTALLGVLVCLALSQYLSRWTFGGDDYASAFAMLSPAVGMMAVQGGEMAVLKGMKQLRRVAVISVYGALATLAICAPVYYFMGMHGIVLSLVLCSVVTLVIHLHFSTKAVPWSLALFAKDEYGKGLPMLKLGVGYVVAGIFGQGAEYVIRTLILQFGELADVGLYNSGYVLAVTYANIVFVAFEADFFPRLSAVQHDVRKQNQTVNRQIRVSVLLMAPLLIFVVLAMPVIVPMLFSQKFIAAVPMAICASFYMFFKALTLPAAYLALAKGDSRMYMITELVYDVFIAIAIPLAFRQWGLMGAGWALSAGGLLDLLLIHIIYRFRYNYRFDMGNMKSYACQFLLFVAAVFASLHENPWFQIVTLVALVASAILSFRALKRETNVLSKIKRRIWRK